MKQRLEVREGEYTNTITSVAKDNYIVEIRTANKQGYDTARGGME